VGKDIFGNPRRGVGVKRLNKSEQNRKLLIGRGGSLRQYASPRRAKKRKKGDAVPLGSGSMQYQQKEGDERRYPSKIL